MIRLLRSGWWVLPVAVVFVIWDLYAIDSQHWFFDPDQMTGITFGILPLEELLFFIVVIVMIVTVLFFPKAPLNEESYWSEHPEQKREIGDLDV